MKTQRPTYFLIANLGSELIRFFALQKRNDVSNAKLSASRAFRIINQIMKQESNVNGKREIAMFRKIIRDSLSGSHVYNVSDDELNSYFMPFASRVRSSS